MINELEIASTEIIEIFKLLPNEKVNKVPIKLRNYFNSMAKTQYSVNIDPNKRLLEQNISEKAKDIIALLYVTCWSPSRKKPSNMRYSDNKRSKKI